jgi:ribosomal protein S27AE
MREWRKTHPLKGEARMKMNARAYAHVYLKRGKLTRGVCETCGSAKSEMHHEDYSKPLVVRWLCRRCHLALHRN